MVETSKRWLQNHFPGEVRLALRWVQLQVFILSVDETTFGVGYSWGVTVMLTVDSELLQ